MKCCRGRYRDSFMPMLLSFVQRCWWCLCLLNLQYSLPDTLLYYITILYFIFLGFFCFFVPYTNTNIGGTCYVSARMEVRGVGCMGGMSMRNVYAITQSWSVECSMRRRSASASVKFKTPWYSRNDCSFDITDSRCARILGRSSSLRLGSASWVCRKMMSLLISWRKRIRIFLVVPSGTWRRIDGCGLLKTISNGVRSILRI